MQQNRERLGREQPIKITAEVQVNYRNLNYPNLNYPNLNYPSLNKNYLKKKNLSSQKSTKASCCLANAFSEQQGSNCDN